MITTALKKIFGSRNDRELKRIGKMVKSINELEASYDALSDDDLRAKTGEFRGRITAGATLDQLLPERARAVWGLNAKFFPDSPYSPCPSGRRGLTQ